MPNFKEPFTQFIHATNLAGSNMTSSHILALNWLNKMLETNPSGFEGCKDVWQINSIDELKVSVKNDNQLQN